MRLIAFLLAIALAAPAAAQEVEARRGDLWRAGVAGVGSGIFALGAGIFFTLRHEDVESSREKAMDARRAELSDEADDVRTWMAVSYATAGVLLGAGVALLIAEDYGEVSATPLEEGASFVWTARF